MQQIIKLDREMLYLDFFWMVIMLKSLQLWDVLVTQVNIQKRNINLHLFLLQDSQHEFKMMVLEQNRTKQTNRQERRKQLLFLYLHKLQIVLAHFLSLVEMEIHFNSGLQNLGQRWKKLPQTLKMRLSIYRT